jgi:hypothetical protein
MKKQSAVAGVVAACLISSTFAHASVTITKSPDLGPFWFPLSTSGSFGYADSFVAPSSGPVADIGLWLTNFSGDTSSQPLVFEVVGSAGGGGPDTTDVLATTGALTLDVTSSLSLFSESTTSSANLIAGDTYWVVGDEVGLSGGGQVQVGGHTQNSEGIVDNGTFWFSDDPSGVSFLGPNTTEMAFTVTLSSSVPEPSTWAMMLLGFAGLGFAGYRRSRKAVSIGV